MSHLTENQKADARRCHGMVMNALRGHQFERGTLVIVLAYFLAYELARLPREDDTRTLDAAVDMIRDAMALIRKARAH